MNYNPYEGLRFTVKEINLNFKIKVSGINKDGKKIHSLVGVSGLINLIGIDLTNNLLDKAFNKGLDCCVCKLRRGLKVSFYSF